MLTISLHVTGLNIKIECSIQLFLKAVAALMIGLNVLTVFPKDLTEVHPPPEITVSSQQDAIDQSQNAGEAAPELRAD